jgi:hypothetical protein
MVDNNEVQRYGTLIVRYSYLSMRWVLFDGTVLVDQYASREEAIDAARLASGRTEADQDTMSPIPPVETSARGLSISPDVAASLSSLSSPSSPIISLPSSEPPPVPEPPSPGGVSGASPEGI